jgi:hypothetical protein
MLKQKQNIRIVQDNLFESVAKIINAQHLGSTIIVPHVCNNVGVFGAGFAAGIKKYYPIVATNFELLGKKTKLGYVQYVSTLKDDIYNHELIFANMIAQQGLISKNNPRPLNYEFLVRCMVDLRNQIQRLDKEKIEIHCPKFGSHLAGGNWNFINDLIHDIWHSFNVVIYYL